MGLFLQLLFPGDLVGKESACNAGDLGSVPGSERSSGGENGQIVKNLLAMQETQVQSLGPEDPLK